MIYELRELRATSPEEEPDLSPARDAQRHGHGALLVPLVLCLVRACAVASGHRCTVGYFLLLCLYVYLYMYTYLPHTHVLPHTSPALLFFHLYLIHHSLSLLVRICTYTTYVYVFSLLLLALACHALGL
jgi:hypothetical protein